MPSYDPHDTSSHGGQASAQPLHWHNSISLSPTSAEHADVETELAQTYLEYVVPSFTESCTNVEQTWVWQVFVPAQALVCSTIRHGLLAMAAIYIHTRAQEGGKVPHQKFLELATSHGNAFVEQSRAQLYKLEPQQTNANVAATRLLAVLALAFYRQERANRENQEMSWTWIHLFRGVKTVHESLLRSGQTIQPRILEDMIPKSPMVDSDGAVLPDSPAASSRSGEILLYISRTSSARFATLRSANSQGWLGANGLEPNVLSAAIDDLSGITERVCAGQYTSLFRVLVGWSTNLDTAVVQMLTDSHPGVMAIYTHWLILLTLAEDLWWIGDMGRAGIRDVLHTIGGSTNDLAPVLSWPREVLHMK